MLLAICPPFCSLFSGKINILTTGTNAERYYVTSLCKYCRVHLFVLLDIDFPTLQLKQSMIIIYICIFNVLCTLFGKLQFDSVSDL